MHERLKLLWKIAWDLLPTRQKIMIRLSCMTNNEDQAVCEL